ncbi:hypothetical protein BOX37_12580 [Nocardia mangyaensis]|uniref:Response regulatory domain-containing protein n=1 Tax=Nocardia mangyaensis TaxID=2213200 RepID=A0A1J0VRJ7_9NOCA|nr:hypothetical protein BOX37_12580 [Nocardia mangyaensis]
MGVDLTPSPRLGWVRTLAEAGLLLRTDVPDCVLCDLHLTDANGLEALARIREDNDRVAIVVMTVFDREHIGLAALASGAQDYLVKGWVESLLGGDFYDVMQDPNGLVHAIIGDVSGHGPDAAATGVALRVNCRAMFSASGSVCRRSRWVRR